MRLVLEARQLVGQYYSISQLKKVRIDCQMKTWTDCCELFLKDHNLRVLIVKKYWTFLKVQ